MDVKQIDQFAPNELLRIVWKLGKDIVEHDVDDIVTVLCEYLQNAHDAADPCDSDGEFRAIFTPNEFSFSHNVGIWSPSNVESVFVPGDSDKDEHSGKIGRFGVGSLSAFRYATKAKVSAPGERNTYEICVDWTKQQKVVSELSVQAGQRETSFVFKVRPGADYVKELEDLGRLLDQPKYLIWRLGVPFLDHIAKVFLQVNLNDSDAIGPSRLAIKKAGYHRMTISFESRHRKGEEIYSRAEHVVNGYTFTHIYRPSCQLPDVARFFRVLPLVGSESVPFSIFTTGDFPFDHRRRAPSARLRTKPSARALFDAYVESIAKVIEDSVAANNYHLRFFCLSQSGRRGGWSMLGDEVAAFLRRKNVPIYVGGRPVSVNEIRLDEIMFDDVSLGSATSIAPDLVGSTVVVANDDDSHEFNVLRRFFGCQPYTVSELAGFYGNLADRSRVRAGLKCLLRAGETLPRKIRGRFYSLIGETRVSAFGGLRLTELASPAQNPYLSDNVTEQNNQLSLPEKFNRFTRARSSRISLSLYDILELYRLTQNAGRAVLAALYEVREATGDLSRDVRFICDVLREVFPSTLWAVSWRSDIRALFTDKKWVEILDQQVSLTDFRGRQLDYVRQLLEKATESRHNIRTFAIAFRERLGCNEPLTIPAQRALFQLLLRYRLCWDRKTDGSVISRLRRTYFMTGNGMVGMPNQILWDAGNLRGLIPGPFADTALVIELAEQGERLSRQLGFRHAEDLSEAEVKQAWSLPPARLVELFRSQFLKTREVIAGDATEMLREWRSLPRLIEYLKAHLIDDVDECLLFLSHKGEPRRAADSIIVETPEDAATAAFLDAGQATRADVLALTLTERISDPETLLQRRVTEAGRDRMGWLITLRERIQERSAEVPTLAALVDAVILRLAKEAYEKESAVFSKKGSKAYESGVGLQGRIPVPSILIPFLGWARFPGFSSLVAAEDLLIESWTQIVDEFTPPLLEVITKHVETVSELDDVQFIQRLVNELRRSGSLLLQTGATEQAKQALFAAVDKLESRLDECLLFLSHKGEPRRAADSIIVETPEDAATAAFLDAGQATRADVLALTLTERISDPETLLQRRVTEAGRDRMGWLITLRERIQERSAEVPTLAALVDAVILRLAKEAYDKESAVFSKKGSKAYESGGMLFENLEAGVGLQGRIPVPSILIPFLGWARFPGFSSLVAAEDLLIESWTQIVDEFTPPLLEVITKHVETVSELDDVQFIQRLVNELRRSGSLLLQTGATEQAKQALFAAVDKLESRLRLPQRGFRTLIGTSTICFKVAANILLSPFAFVEHIIGIVKVIREGHSHDRPVSLRRAFGVSLIIFATVASVVTVVRWSLDTGYRLPEFTVRAISVGLMLSAVTAALASLTIPKTFHFLQTSSLLLILVASSVIVLAKATVTQMLGSALPAWQDSAILLFGFAAVLFFISHVAAGDKAMAVRGLSVLLTALFVVNVLVHLALNQKLVLAVGVDQQSEIALRPGLYPQQPQDTASHMPPPSAVGPIHAALTHLGLFNNAYQQIIDQTKPPFYPQTYETWLRSHEND